MCPLDLRNRNGLWKPLLNCLGETSDPRPYFWVYSSEQSFSDQEAKEWYLDSRDFSGDQEAPVNQTTRTSEMLLKWIDLLLTTQMDFLQRNNTRFLSGQAKQVPEPIVCVRHGLATKYKVRISGTEPSIKTTADRRNHAPPQKPCFPANTNI